MLVVRGTSPAEFSQDRYSEATGGWPGRTVHEDASEPLTSSHLSAVEFFRFFVPTYDEARAPEVKAYRTAMRR